MQTRLALTCRSLISSTSPNLTSEQPVHLAQFTPSPASVSVSLKLRERLHVGRCECHLPARLSAGADSIFFPFAFRPTFFSASSARPVRRSTRGCGRLAASLSPRSYRCTVGFCTTERKALRPSVASGLVWFCASKVKRWRKCRLTERAHHRTPSRLFFPRDVSFHMANR